MSVGTQQEQQHCNRIGQTERQVQPAGISIGIFICEDHWTTSSSRSPTAIRSSNRGKQNSHPRHSTALTRVLAQTAAWHDMRTFPRCPPSLVPRPGADANQPFAMFIGRPSLAASSCGSWTCVTWLLSEALAPIKRRSGIEVNCELLGGLSLEMAEILSRAERDTEAFAVGCTCRLALLQGILLAA